MAAPKGQIPPQLRPFIKGKGKATGKTSRVTAAQAKSIAARMAGKKMPMDAEDKLDHGADEAQEDAQGNVIKKGRTVADALSVNSRLKGKV